MFKKLLKYDFKYSKRFGIPILIALAVTCLIASIDVVVLNSGAFDDDNFGFLEILVTVTLSFSALAAVGAIVGTQIIIYENFYKSLLTDEGYLTFTLPVKAKDIIFSKMTNGAIWTLIIGAATFVGVIIVAVVGILTSPPSIYPDVPIEEAVFSVYDIISTILGIILGIVSYFATQLLYFVVIFCGSSSFSKDKPGKIVLSILVANFALSTLSTIVITAITLLIEEVSGTLVSADVISIIMISLELLIMAGLGIGMFFLLKHTMEKKINLP